jgi:uncharacterized protein (DUF983 family)
MKTSKTLEVARNSPLHYMHFHNGWRGAIMICPGCMEPTLGQDFSSPPTQCGYCHCAIIPVILHIVQIGRET